MSRILTAVAIFIVSIFSCFADQLVRIDEDWTKSWPIGQVFASQDDFETNYFNSIPKGEVTIKYDDSKIPTATITLNLGSQGSLVSELKFARIYFRTEDESVLIVDMNGENVLCFLPKVEMNGINGVLILYNDSLFISQ